MEEDEYDQSRGHLIQILVEKIVKGIVSKNMTANLKYMKDCYMEDEIDYHFMLHEHRKVLCEEKSY